MRLSSFSLPLALSLVSPALAGILEDNDYEIESFEGVDSVIYVGEQQDLTVDIIGFYPEMGAATIYLANNDVQPDSDSKLGLRDVYNALAEKHGLHPDDIRWLAINVGDNTEAEQLIMSIRRNRNLGLQKVSILPTDREWDMMLETEYYKQARLVNRRPLDRIVIKTHYTYLEGYVLPTDRIEFSFRNLEDAQAEDGTSRPFNGDAQEAEMMALYEEQKKKEIKSLAAVDAELAQSISDMILDDKAPAPYF